MYKKIMKKISMTEHQRECLIKVSILAAAFFGLNFVFITPWVLSMFLSYEKLYLVFKISGILFFVSGGIMIFLLCTLDQIIIKPVKGEKLPSPFTDFEETVEYFDEATGNQGYEKHEQVCVSENAKMQVYSQRKLDSRAHFVILNRIKQMEDDTLDTFDEVFDKFITNYFAGSVTGHVHLTIVMCVDRVTPQFYKFVDNNIHNGLKLFQLPAGISYGGKQIYIAKQKDGFAIMKYKKMRKEFLELLDIDPIPTKKEKDVLN